MKQRRFTDRPEAGKRLAERLRHYVDNRDVVVLGLPRGGVPVAYEVARVLKVPLDVFVVRKLGVPGREELAMGAVASGGVRILNPSTVEVFGISTESIEAITQAEERELRRRERIYRDDRDAPDVAGRTVILVDDGLATGATMHAAVQALRKLRPESVVLAVPVAPTETLYELRPLFDEVIYLMAPSDFGSVGRWYVDFDQTTDDDVRALLHKATHPED